MERKIRKAAYVLPNLPDSNGARDLPMRRETAAALKKCY